MKKYIGTKQVSAEPMNLGGFIKQTGRNPYANSSDMHGDNEEGYIVAYKDGYKSWSPKEVFEEAYKCADTFIDRLKVELAELDEKQSRLNAFFDTNIFKGLDEHRKRLMRAQFGAMLAYSQILIERIKIEEENQQ